VAISQESTGLIHNFAVGSSELDVARQAIARLPSGSLFIGDELYNCYGFWSDLARRGVEFIVPAKRKRTYELAQELGAGDALVRIQRPAPSKTSLWAGEYNQLPPAMILRRITYTNPESPDNQRVLITSLTNPAIPATDIVAKYTSRWDIELRIRGNQDGDGHPHYPQQNSRWGVQGNSGGPDRLQHHQRVNHRVGSPRFSPL
jgi:hypothetical protein